MSATVVIPRGDASTHPSWRPFGRSAVVTCGGCGASMRLDHDVAADGTVSPSLDCPGCSWHVWGRLDGWQGQPSSVSGSVMVFGVECHAIRVTEMVDPDGTRRTVTVYAGSRGDARVEAVDADRPKCRWTVHVYGTVLAAVGGVGRTVQAAEARARKQFGVLAEIFGGTP